MITFGQKVQYVIHSVKASLHEEKKWMYLDGRFWDAEETKTLGPKKKVGRGFLGEIEKTKRQKEDEKYFSRFLEIFYI